MYRLTIFAFLLLTGCGPSPAEKAAEEVRIAEMAVKVKTLERQLNAAKAAENQQSTRSAPAAEESKEAIERGEGWCFKDYCPCESDPDNNATEQLHCDMMETGGEVDDKMLAVGRSMREVRRQLRTGDY